MKQLNVLVLLFFSLLILSCNKNKEQVTSQPQQDSSINNLPNFSESNSKKINWDELPGQLKNAIQIETSKDDKTDREARTAFSTYRYAVGPWGGGGGSAFYYIYPPNGSRIYAIAVSSGIYVDRLIVWYITSNGSIYMGGDRGGNGGSYFLNFFSPDEYIYYAAGRSGNLLDHLTLYTNKKTLSYGGTGGSPFYVSVPTGSQILGFYGGSGIYIDRLGFYIYTL